MSEPRDVTGILQDISVLYELSLSVGRSIELDENCDGFLRTLMARKSFDFAAVWIRDGAAAGAEGAGDALTLVYANPAFRVRVKTVAGDHPIVARLEREPRLSLSSGPGGFDAAISDPGVDRGTFAVFRLGDVGVLELFSFARAIPFSDLELGKLRHVVDKFTVSLEGCLDHARVRLAEQRRRELELQMLHAQKLESLGVLAGGVAHDFNNLLTVILGNAELARPLPGEPPDPAHVDAIIEAAKRAADLCSQLLAYSGRSTFVERTLSLNEIVEEMLRLTAVTVSKKASVRQALASDLPAIDGDATQIRQVVMNLITNASEALGDTMGELAVSTGVLEITTGELADYHLGELGAPGRYVRLDVEDTGCGMDDETRRRIFDPFFTTKFTGRGLGLAAVLGIVRGHRGALRVRSAPGRGTRVRVVFPASEVLPPAQAPPEVPAEGEPRSGTILVVDDEPAVRELFRRVIARMGIQAIFAADGGEAIRIFRERRREIDLVLLDMTMPVMGGDEVFRAILRLDPSARVVVTSGYSEVETTDRFEGAAPTAFLTKPFEAAHARRVIGEALPKAPGAPGRAAPGPARPT